MIWITVNTALSYTPVFCSSPLSTIWRCRESGCSSTMSWRTAVLYLLVGIFIRWARNTGGSQWWFSLCLW